MRKKYSDPYEENKLTETLDSVLKRCELNEFDNKFVRVPQEILILTLSNTLRLIFIEQIKTFFLN